MGLTWRLSIRETPTEIFVFLYTQSILVFSYANKVYIVSLHTNWVYFILKYIELFSTILKSFHALPLLLLLYIELSILSLSTTSRVHYFWVEPYFTELNILILIWVSYLWVSYLIVELSWFDLSMFEKKWECFLVIKFKHMLCFSIPLTCSCIPRTESVGLHTFMMKIQVFEIINKSFVDTTWNSS